MNFITQKAASEIMIDWDTTSFAMKYHTNSVLNIIEIDKNDITNKIALK